MSATESHSEPTAATVGIIGLGLMGQAFARRLIGSGRPVLGYDVAADKGAAFRSIGGHLAGSVGEVAAQCSVIILAVMTIGQVEEVMTAGGGIIDKTPEGRGTTVLCCSTCEAARIEALAALASSKAIAFLDAPASGTSKQVGDGEGVGLVGGDPEAIAAAHALILAIYPRYFVTGAAGSATLTKLAVNHILGLNRLALAEGLVFAATIGLDAADFLDIAKSSAAQSQVMYTKGDKMVRGDFEPVSKVSQHLKDVRVIVGEARARGQDLPLASVLLDVLEACERNGDGERDNAIIIEEIRRRRR